MTAEIFSGRWAGGQVGRWAAHPLTCSPAHLLTRSCVHLHNWDAPLPPGDLYSDEPPLETELHLRQIILLGSQDKTIKLWHLHTGELLHTLTGHWGEVNSIVISSDGKTLVSSSWDETIRLWHLSTGTELHSLSGHQGAVACAAIAPNGQKIVSGSWDQTIRVWGVRN